jgi:hypothetical protein
VKRFAVFLLVAGCSVVDEPYPLIWEPLPDGRAAGCERFQGTYADRGEAPGQTARPSLTRELFGADSPWEAASSVKIDLAGDGAAVTVNGPDKPIARHFSAKAGEFRCEDGKLVLRNRRWVTSDLMSGRETVKLILFEADPFLVVHLHESMTGLMFMVVPLSGESSKWYRFARLKP